MALGVPFVLPGLPATAAVSGSSSNALQLFLPPSPPTTPWVEELPIHIAPVTPRAALDPAPTIAANTARGEAGRDPHQRFAELGGNAALYYELRARQRDDWVFHRDYPPQRIWGYAANDGVTVAPGPLLHAHYGQPILVRFHNELPQTPQQPQGPAGPYRNLRLFGSPEISTHLHNAHTASESDGFAGDYYSPVKAGPTLTAPGRFKDHFYPNILAGYDQLQNGKGDPNEALGTLFYHDHTLDFTAANLQRGLFGFFLLFDELDSGNELDPLDSALRLPSGDYDYPLAFADRQFDEAGYQVWDAFNPEGLLGDKITVNGKLEPVLRVAARKYRLRLLNAGPSRFYAFFLVDARNRTQRFTYIANDGNLLPAPLREQTNVVLGVAERADIVVDFAKYPPGTELYLINRMRQIETRGPKDIKDTGPRVLKFLVDRVADDQSRVPDLLRPLPPLPSAAALAALPVRRWVFERDSGLWTINAQLVNVSRPRAQIRQGAAEIWELANLEDGWSHPIHIHFEEGRIIERRLKGKVVAIPPHERGRKDVYVLEEFETLRIYLRFRDFHGKYLMHCHNTIHEDHAMMLRWDLLPS
ncbi:multicopper oxidase domain-containing protein [Pseudomonas sp. UL073]|uniref:Multicopper oxidase domain-containing protein n=2 Tax=Zestomonas insulae TaxID=2809017 RepID=A0ABS2IGT8_9GAMM|nr:multicopper oxidase domain-containing protein [Pseudomonas insulae]